MLFLKELAARLSDKKTGLGGYGLVLLAERSYSGSAESTGASIALVILIKSGGGAEKPLGRCDRELRLIRRTLLLPSWQSGVPELPNRNPFRQVPSGCWG